MMKLMKIAVMLVILCGGLQLSHGEKLKCEFEYANYYLFGDMYSCKVSSLDNSFDNITIGGYTGVQEASKIDKDVKGIWIQSENTKYIPKGLGSVFNIIALKIQNSDLVEIRSKDFQGMLSLEYLSLYNNKLTSVLSDVFSTLSNLKVIYLHSNQIKYIGSGAFDQLTKLNILYLNDNICLNKDYDGATAITQMKHDIILTCDKRNDVIQYEITKNREEIKSLNEMMKQLLIASKDHQMDRQENIKLISELSLAKDELKKEHDEKIKITNEREQLEKENADLKKTIEEKLPKMKQTIEDFYMEVMDLKIERHYKREDLIALRSKLMEAKEQLAECKINERISCYLNIGF